MSKETRSYLTYWDVMKLEFKEGFEYRDVVNYHSEMIKIEANIVKRIGIGHVGWV